MISSSDSVKIFDQITTKLKFVRHFTIAATGFIVTLTFSNPIFLPPAYSPALIYFGREKAGGLLVIILQF
jgi:hypothetical protein